jgi:hypothetical protein
MTRRREPWWTRRRRNDQLATIQARALALDRLVEKAFRCMGFPDGLHPIP